MIRYIDRDNILYLKNKYFSYLPDLARQQSIRDRLLIRYGSVHKYDKVMRSFEFERNIF